MEYGARGSGPHADGGVEGSGPALIACVERYLSRASTAARATVYDFDGCEFTLQFVESPSGAEGGREAASGTTPCSSGAGAAAEYGDSTPCGGAVLCAADSLPSLRVELRHAVPLDELDVFGNFEEELVGRGGSKGDGQHVTASVDAPPPLLSPLAQSLWVSLAGRGNAVQGPTAALWVPSQVVSRPEQLAQALEAAAQLRVLAPLPAVLHIARALVSAAGSRQPPLVVPSAIFHTHAARGEVLAVYAHQRHQHQQQQQEESRLDGQQQPLLLLLTVNLRPTSADLVEPTRLLLRAFAETRQWGSSGASRGSTTISAAPGFVYVEADEPPPDMPDALRTAAAAAAAAATAPRTTDAVFWCTFRCYALHLRQPLAVRLQAILARVLNFRLTILNHIHATRRAMDRRMRERVDGHLKLLQSARETAARAAPSHTANTG